MNKKLKKIICIIAISVICIVMARCQNDDIETTSDDLAISSVKEWFGSNGHNLESLAYSKKIDWENALLTNGDEAKTIEVPLILLDNTTTNVVDDSGYKTYMSLLFVSNENEGFQVFDIIYTTKNEDYKNGKKFNLYNIDSEYSGYITIQNNKNKIIYSGEFENGQHIRYHNRASGDITTSRFVCTYYVTVGPITTCSSWMWVPDDFPMPGVPYFPGGPSFPGGQPAPIIKLDPCAQATTMTIDGKNPVFLSAKNNILSADPSIEHSITLTKSNDKMGQTAMTNGGASDVKVDTNWHGSYAAMHNHPNNTQLSAGDIYAAITLNKNNVAFTTSYILTGGEVYAIVVTDLQKAKDFATAFPADQIAGYNPEFPDILFDQLQELVTTFGSTIDGKTEAMSVILNKYDAGVSLMKQDSSGQFKPINVKESVLPNGSKTYISIPCN